MPHGTVIWFNDDKGFGFIEQDADDEDVFVHWSEIDQDGFKSLNKGDDVVFETEQTDDGIAAVDVKPADSGQDNGSKPETTSEPETTPSSSDEQIEESFDDLGIEQPILDTLKQAGFDEPRPIQVKSIPDLISNRDLIGTAPTGTGKTAAFLLPMIQQLHGRSEGDPGAVILAPTHELAEQITEEARMLSKGMDIGIESVYGGTDVWDEKERLNDNDVDILIACPGRLLDHIGRGNIVLRDVEICVLDEADRMCDMGFLPDIKDIMARLPKDRQDLFFSATIPPEIEQLGEQMLDNPISVSIGTQSPAETISHYVCEVGSGDKYQALTNLLDSMETDSVLIFCRTRETVKNLARGLRNNGYDASPLQGGMDPIAREATLSGFREQSFDILIATNVAARGLDVDHISHVINYDVPEDPDVYTHRIGRTGRAGSLGDAFTLSTPDDAGDIKDIERTIDQTIERYQINS